MPASRAQLACLGAKADGLGRFLRKLAVVKWPCLGILSTSFLVIYGRNRQNSELGSGAAMARVCEICGKRAQMGNSVETRGKAKYLGGVGTKITGIARRQFRPNLQRVRVATPEGGAKSIKVCTQCIRSGSVRKAVKQKPFKLPG